MRLSHLGDELLARHAARGSERAFATLYERYHQQLYRYCRSILRDDTDSQDALQSTFTGAFQALRRGQRNAPLRPWLYRIAHNESISLLRRRARTATEELNPESMGVGGSVEQEAADRARWQGLVTDLGALPERQRGALLLRELSGLSHEDIAIALGTSAAAAKQAIFEARQALAEVAEGRAMSCEEVRRRVSEGDRRLLRGRRVNAHLHACTACEAFALAIPERRNQLRAFAPVLAPGAAAAVLSRSVHTAYAQSGTGGASGAASAGAVGKVASSAIIWKAAAGVVVLAAAAGGVTGLRHLLTPSRTAARTSGAQIAHSRSGHRAGGHSARAVASGSHARFGRAGDRAGSRHASAASRAGSRPGAGAPAGHSTSTTGASHVAATGTTQRSTSGSGPGSGSKSSGAGPSGSNGGGGQGQGGGGQGGGGGAQGGQGGQGGGQGGGGQGGGGGQN